MLDNDLKQQVREIFKDLKSNYIFEIKAAEDHPERDEMIALLQDVADTSDKIDIQIINMPGLSFRIIKDNVPASFIFKAIPNGHEFTTLLLAILNLEGKGKNLPDKAITERIASLEGPIKIKSYISLTCTNCPEVVQALNVFSMINPSIEHEIIDGSLIPDEMEKLNIKAVPSVFADDKPLFMGRAPLAEILEKLEEKYPSSHIYTGTEVEKYDLIIAGGGPAGCAAAIYSARKGLKVAMIAERIGGQVLETVGIENLISVVSTTGRELAAHLYEHLSDYPISILQNRKISNVEIVDGEKILTTSLGEKFSTEALIITTGASWRRLNVPGESDYIGAGIAFCTHCDGPFYKGKRVAVIGGGNSGLEAAIDLSAIATEVTVIEFADTLKGDKVLQEKIATLPNVKVATNLVSEEIIGDGKSVTAIRYKNRTTGESTTLDIDGVFIQIGLTANSAPFKDFVETNRMGEIVVDNYCRTNVKGVYAAGDVSTVPYKQIIIAMGEGAKAALSAFDDRIKGELK